jgi:hypothetical protein
MINTRSRETSRQPYAHPQMNSSLSNLCEVSIRKIDEVSTQLGVSRQSAERSLIAKKSCLTKSRNDREIDTIQNLRAIQEVGWSTNAWMDRDRGRLVESSLGLVFDCCSQLLLLFILPIEAALHNLYKIHRLLRCLSVSWISSGLSSGSMR